MAAILRLGLKFFAASAALLAGVLALAYFIDLAGHGALRQFIFDRLFGDQKEPILFVHVTWNVEDLLGSVFAYLLLCMILAWVWTRIRTRTRSPR